MELRPEVSTKSEDMTPVGPPLREEQEARTAPQAHAQPLFLKTTQLTDRVYIFRYQGHQSMFIVTPQGSGGD